MNNTPLLCTPSAFTTTFPVVVPDGTVATIDVALQLPTVVAVVPLKDTEPCVDPKFVPVIVTDDPTAPDVGDKLVMLGVPSTVNDSPLLDTPPTVTTTAPVVAPEGTGVMMLVVLQLVGAAVVPLNVTVLEPRVEPKFDPLIETCAPTASEAGDRALIVAVVPGTIKLTPLLGTPLTVTTT